MTKCHNVGNNMSWLIFELKILLQKGLSEVVFYGDLVYKIEKMLESLILVINEKIINTIKNGIQHGYHETVYMAGCKPNHG